MACAEQVQAEPHMSVARLPDSGSRSPSCAQTGIPSTMRNCPCDRSGNPARSETRNGLLASGIECGTFLPGSACPVAAACTALSGCVARVARLPSTSAGSFWTRGDSSHRLPHGGIAAIARACRGRKRATFLGDQYAEFLGCLRRGLHIVLWLARGETPEASGDFGNSCRGSANAALRCSLFVIVLFLVEGSGRLLAAGQTLRLAKPKRPAGLCLGALHAFATLSWLLLQPGEVVSRVTRS
jgi:hypothetical protein